MDVPRASTARASRTLIPSRSPHSSGPRSKRLFRALASFATWSCALLLLLALIPAAQAAEGGQPVPAVDGWRYRWGDSPVGADGVPTWAKDAGQQGWRSMEALKEPPERGDNTFVWISIPVPDGGWNEPALFLGEVTNAVEVYAAGRNVYTSGTLNRSGYEVTENLSWHLVPLPREALGGRVLLRIQSNNPNIGVFQNAQVGAHHELLAFHTREGQVPFITGILMLAVAIGAGGAFIIHWRRRMLAGLAVFAASGGLLLVSLSGLPDPLWGTAAIATRGMIVSVFMLTPGLMAFVSDALLDNRVKWFLKGSVVFSAIAVLCALITLVDLGTGQRLMVPFMPPGIVCLLVCLGLAGAEAWRGNPDARLFLFGFCVLVISIVINLLPVLGVVDWTLGNVTHWGYLALTLSLLAVVARRSIEVVRALELHTQQLEERQHEVRSLAERMGTGAGELATVVQQLRASSDQQTEGVSRQAAALQEAEQTVKEIRRTSLMTAEKASALAASAENAEQVGREGTAALERTLSDLAAIRTEV